MRFSTPLTEIQKLEDQLRDSPYVDEPVSSVEQLPGYDECGTRDLPWLSEDKTEFTIAAGASRTVTVTSDSTVLSQPGTYTAELAVRTDSPYDIALSRHPDREPPASWARSPAR